MSDDVYRFHDFYLIWEDIGAEMQSFYLKVTFGRFANFESTIAGHKTSPKVIVATRHMTQIVCFSRPIQR